MEITGIIEKECRPCKVHGRKAIFHQWAEICKPVEPSPTIGGHSGGEYRRTYAIVEFENGTIAEVYPESVTFCDNKVNCIWKENATVENTPIKGRLAKEIPLEDVNLSVRSYNALKLAGYKNLEDILLLNVNDLLRVKHLGERGIQEVNTIRELYNTTEIRAKVNISNEKHKKDNNKE